MQKTPTAKISFSPLASPKNRKSLKIAYPPRSFSKLLTKVNYLVDSCDQFASGSKVANRSSSRMDKKSCMILSDIKASKNRKGFLMSSKKR